MSDSSTSSLTSTPSEASRTAEQGESFKIGRATAADWVRALTSERALAFGILALAAVLRTISLGAVGLNSDEAVYLGQAASLAQAPELEPLFPIFRAHPLLFHVLLSQVFRLGVSDVAGRLLSAALGTATVWLTYRTGRLLYGSLVGLAGALFLAVMPYHVVVSRQVLLDGPMTLFATLTLYLLARFASDPRPIWMYAAGASLGLTFLAKETGIVLFAAVYVFLALSPRLQVRLRDLALSAGFLILAMSPYPITLALAGGLGAGRTQQYLTWQLSRRPNHEWSFYPESVAPALGLPLLLLALAALVLLRRRNSYREVLLTAWIVVPAVFFQLWPVKGFHYLLLIAPPVAILAGRALELWPSDRTYSVFRRAFNGSAVRTAVMVLVAAGLVYGSLGRLQGPRSGRFLAGSGGVPGGREAGLWLRENSPEGSTLMTIGPSMANILQFYGHRRAFGLSVSPNPLHRNPAYQPIRNPDFELRTGEIQYVVWDAYSAARSSFFSDKILSYAERYDGRVVHTETILVTTPEGEQAAKPVIIIYEVRP